MNALAPQVEFVLDANRLNPDFDESFSYLALALTAQNFADIMEKAKLVESSGAIKAIFSADGLTNSVAWSVDALDEVELHVTEREKWHLVHDANESCEGTLIEVYPSHVVLNGVPKWFSESDASRSDELSFQTIQQAFEQAQIKLKAA